MHLLSAPDKSRYISKNWPFDTLETNEQVNCELDIWQKLQGIMSSANATIGNPNMDERTREQLEAAVFRRLVAHFRERTDVQNIDLMTLAGFCRNCLGDWYRDAAAEKHNMLRIVDESGEDYLYPKAFFRAIAVPQAVRRAVLAA